MCLTMLGLCVGASTLPVCAFAQDAAGLAAGEDAWNKAGCLQCHAVPAKAVSAASFRPARACAHRSSTARA
jgi:hypothetical protein